MVKSIGKRFDAQVHCPICTHTVGAEVEQLGRKLRVVAGQKCPRCAAILDAAAVLEVREAA